MTERASRGNGAPEDFVVGDWLAQPSLNRISRGAETLRLRPQLMNLLVCLADRPGQTVSREDILAGVWPGQFVAETGLARCIAELRQALGDTAGHEARYIETIPKRGYRLIAAVQPAPSAPALPASVVASPAAAPSAAVAVSAGSTPAGDLVVAPTASVPVASPAEAAEPEREGQTRRSSAPHLTWRLAVAVAVLVAAVLAGSLAWRRLASPPAVERDTLVISFENTTGDPVFDGALRLALSTQLEQSPYLRVVSEQRVRDELRFMNRAPDGVITRAIALDVCQRVGAKAVVAGSLAALGRHYAVGLEGVACDSGEVIARQQVEAAAREQVLGALGQAVSSIRQHLGESVASIRRYDVPIAQVTTGSLEALKAFSQGDFERGRGNDDDAVRFFRRAIEVDPSFALAHVRLGLQLLNLARYGEGIEELKRAYAVREHASEAERLYITSFYYTGVLRDPIKGVEPLESWRDAYPRNAIPRFTLAVHYLRIGLLEEALREAREAVRLEPGNALAASVLVDALMRNGRLAEARRLGEEQVARGRANVNARVELAEIAIALGDDAAFGREVEWAATRPAAAAAFVEIQGSLARASGRMQAASVFTGRRSAAAEERGDMVLAAIALLDEATDRAMAGQVREPLSLALAGLNKARTPETLIRAALAFAWAGQTDGAEAMLRDYEAMPDVVPTSDPDSRPAVLALLAMNRGLPQSAVEVLAPLRPYELGWRFNFLPPYIRGLALLRLHRPAEAAANFDRITNNRGALPESIVSVLAWLQLGRAKAAAGDANGARQAYERFLRYWKDSDPELPAAVEARTELARLR